MKEHLICYKMTPESSHNSLWVRSYEFFFGRHPPEGYRPLKRVRQEKESAVDSWVMRSAKSSSSRIMQDSCPTGHQGQILHGSITSALSEPYGNLGKILVGLVRTLW